MSYDQKVTVSRTRKDLPSTGVQRADGKYTFDANEDKALILYAGFADVQDVIKSEERDQVGAPTQLANGIVFLQYEDKINDIRIDDLCEIVWAVGRVENAVIIDVRRLDGSLLIRRIREKIVDGA